MFHTYSIYGNTFAIQCSNQRFLNIVKKYWSAYSIQKKDAKPKIIFQIIPYKTKNPAAYRWPYICNDHFFFLAGGPERITGYLYQFPWQVYLETFNLEDVERLYFYRFEPMFLSLLKRLNLFQWHSAAVAKNGYGILLAGPSGSGKTTTALSLLKSGFKILADDTVFLSQNKTQVHALGHETGLFMTDETISFFPELEFLKTSRRHKKGGLWKRRLEVRSLCQNTPVKETKVRLLLFPKIVGYGKTKMKPLVPSTALMKCLRQKPKELPALIADEIALENQLALYSTLVQSAKSYDLLIGKEVKEIPALVSGLLK